MEKFKLIMFFVLLIAVFVGGIYWDSVNVKKENEFRIATVNKDYKYGRGIISSYHSYKGRSLRVKYTINKKDYEYSGGWSINPNNIYEGDSIWFRYSVEDPNLIITELEKAY